MLELAKGLPMSQNNKPPVRGGNGNYPLPTQLRRVGPQKAPRNTQPFVPRKDANLGELPGDKRPRTAPTDSRAFQSAV
jgi:hypothetical protein